MATFRVLASYHSPRNGFQSVVWLIASDTEDDAAFSAVDRILTMGGRDPIVEKITIASAPAAVLEASS